MKSQFQSIIIKLTLTLLLTTFITSQISQKNLKTFRDNTSDQENKYKLNNLEDILNDSYEYCKKCNGTVINSTIQFDAGILISGLTNQFCLIENDRNNIGLIDLQTLVSDKPSLAATYVLRGIAMDEIPEMNRISDFCQFLKGTSISLYTNGGYDTIYGIDEICVFGDGSKISSWVLIYISESSTYLGLRERIKSKPLPIYLPYQGNGNKFEGKDELNSMIKEEKVGYKVEG